MPSTNFLSAPFGGASTAKFEMGGISELYLLPHNKLLSTTNVLDAFGSVVEVSALALASGSTFQEIGFVEGSASYNDGYKPSATKRYMELALNFTVDASGNEAVEQAHQILLTRRHVALVKRKNNKWYLLGQSDGLVAGESSANSGAKREDDSAMSFTLTGGNLGFAAEVMLTPAELSAVVTRLA